MPVPCLIYHHGKGSTRFATKALVQSSAVLLGTRNKGRINRGLEKLQHPWHWALIGLHQLLFCCTVYCCLFSCILFDEHAHWLARQSMQNTRQLRAPLLVTGGRMTKLLKHWTSRPALTTSCICSRHSRV